MEQGGDSDDGYDVNDVVIQRVETIIVNIPIIRVYDLITDQIICTCIYQTIQQMYRPLIFKNVKIIAEVVISPPELRIY